LTKQAGSDQLYPELEAEAKIPRVISMTLQEKLEAEAKYNLMLPHP